MVLPGFTWDPHPQLLLSDSTTAQSRAASLCCKGEVQVLVSHSPTFPACACLWALLIQTLTHGLASDLPVYHKCVSDMDFGMLLALILPWPVLLRGGGTIPSWWGPALLTWGIPGAACVSGSSQPFLCPDIILKKKTPSMIFCGSKWV